MDLIKYTMVVARLGAILWNGREFLCPGCPGLGSETATMLRKELSVEAFEELRVWFAKAFQMPEFTFESPPCTSSEQYFEILAAWQYSKQQP